MSYGSEDLDLVKKGLDWAERGTKKVGGGLKTCACCACLGVLAAAVLCGLAVYLLLNR